MNKNIFLHGSDAEKRDLSEYEAGVPCKMSHREVANYLTPDSRLRLALATTSVAFNKILRRVTKI